MILQRFLNQSRFPRLWKAFQHIAGGLHDKRALCLEEGSFVRSNEAVQALLRDIPELTLVSSETRVVGASPWSIPKCARFGVYALQRRDVG